MCLETDAQLCERHHKNCGFADLVDVCGNLRTIQCGSCAAGCTNNVCDPICMRAMFDPPADVGVDSAGQDVLAASDGDLASLVVLRRYTEGACFDGFRVFLADGAPGSYVLTEATAFLQDAFPTDYSEQGWALSGDGLTLVGLTLDRKGFQSTRRSARGLVDFGFPDTSAFTEINNMIPMGPGIIMGPLLSPDETWFFFTIVMNGADSGTYLATRTSTLDAFSAPVRLDGIMDNLFVVTGLSADRMTIYTMDNFVARVVHRASPWDPFANPDYPNPPTVFPNVFRAMPNAACTLMLGNYTTAGCVGENVGGMYRNN